jgi:alpha-L-fucosidase
VAVRDRSVACHETRVRLSYIGKVPLDPTAVYLSDLAPVKAFGRGGPKIDRDYRGDVATIGDRIYPKCILLHPEPGSDGVLGEIVFELPADAPRVLHSDIGIEMDAGASGSAVFEVQRGPSATGPWETLYTSPILRGGMGAQTIRVDLGDARFLRLCTTDAGDGINSDHALWGNVRLK